MTRDARSSPALMREAARLINRALLQLEVTEARCPSCQSRLFSNRHHAKVYEQFANLPDRLTDAADKLETVQSEPSAGFVHARAEELRRRYAGEEL